jgi:hypothetical protein
MPRTDYNTVFDKDGNIISQTQVIIPDTKIEKAIATLNANDPNAITNLAQAKTLLNIHHQILLKLLPYVYVTKVFDEDDLN